MYIWTEFGYDTRWFMNLQRARQNYFFKVITTKPGLTIASRDSDY